jgi:hypothetical protein
MGQMEVQLVAINALHPVSTDLNVNAGEVLLVHPAADVIRRLQDQQVRYPCIRQPLPRRDTFTNFIGNKEL